MNLFLVTKHVYRFLKKRYVAHKVHQLLFRARFLYTRNSVCLIVVTCASTEFMI